MRFTLSVVRSLPSRLKEKYRGGSGAELFVHWTTKLATRVRSRVAAGLPTGYSVLGGNLTGYCYQQYRPRLGNPGGNDTHRGLCWK